MFFSEATREKAKLRLALTGVSGSGKTLSALYLAYGLTGDWSRVALIDTEHGRAKFYADRADLGTGRFLHAVLSAPFTPDRVQAVCAGGCRTGGSGWRPDRGQLFPCMGR